MGIIELCALGFAVPLVLAGKDEMTEALSEAQQYNETFRAFGSAWSVQVIDALNGYGCWCYFDGGHGQGRGHPQNGIDSLCKMLADGYDCILSDSAAEGDDDCEPWAVPYNSGPTFNFLSASKPEAALRKGCARANKRNECAERACMVENYFIQHLFTWLLTTGNTFDLDLNHNNGFNRDTCVGTPGTVNTSPASAMQCCATYPKRFPFKDLGGDRSCCGEGTYSTVTHECCAGNIVKVVC